MWPALCASSHFFFSFFTVITVIAPLFKVLWSVAVDWQDAKTMRWTCMAHPVVTVLLQLPCALTCRNCHAHTVSAVIPESVFSQQKNTSTCMQTWRSSQMSLFLHHDLRIFSIGAVPAECLLTTIMSVCTARCTCKVWLSCDSVSASPA